MGKYYYSDYGIVTKKGFIELENKSCCGGSGELVFLGEFNSISEAENDFNEFKEWQFENGIKVCEDEYDYNLHCLNVYNKDDYLGVIYPNTIGDMLKYRVALSNGEDPISGGWEDGCGNVCTLDGWNEL